MEILVISIENVWDGLRRYIELTGGFFAILERLIELDKPILSMYLIPKFYLRDTVKYFLSSGDITFWQITRVIPKDL